MEKSNEIVCPYCGYEYSHSFEEGDSSECMVCPQCENVFSFRAERIVIYTSYKVEKKEFVEVKK